jgi:hypothetical protein
MNEILAHSQVTLNRQIEAAEGSANNMRLFEATGVGAMLVTDDGKNLSDLFRRAEEVVITRMRTTPLARSGASLRTRMSGCESPRRARRGRSTSTPTRVGSPSLSSSLSRG